MADSCQFNVSSVILVGIGGEVYGCYDGPGAAGFVIGEVMSELCDRYVNGVT
jgi:hypothetical protein